MLLGSWLLPASPAEMGADPLTTKVSEGKGSKGAESGVQNTISVKCYCCEVILVHKIRLGHQCKCQMT